MLCIHTASAYALLYWLLWIENSKWFKFSFKSSLVIGFEMKKSNGKGKPLPSWMDGLVPLSHPRPICRPNPVNSLSCFTRWPVRPLYGPHPYLGPTRDWFSVQHVLSFAGTDRLAAPPISLLANPTRQRDMSDPFLLPSGLSFLNLRTFLFSWDRT